MTTDEATFQSIYFSVSLINTDLTITKGYIYTQLLYDYRNIKFIISFLPLIPRNL